MVLVDRLADRKKIARTQHSGKRQHCRTRRGIHTLYFLKYKKTSHEKATQFGPGPLLYFTLGCNSQPDKDKYYFHSLSLSHCHRLFYSFIQPNIFFRWDCFIFSHFFVLFILFILLFVRIGGWPIEKGRKFIFCTIFYVQIRWQRNNFIPVR